MSQLRRSSMPFDPPAGLYCCFIACWMTFTSYIMAAWKHCPLSLHWKLNRPSLATIDCLVAVCTVKHKSVMFFPRKEVGAKLLVISFMTNKVMSGYKANTD